MRGRDHDLDGVDSAIINALQGDFPLSERPYRDAAERIGIGEQDLIDRLGDLLERGVLTRFGPMYHAERMGGALTLCAMAVPPGRFEAVAEQVNAHPEVAHNYERDHRLNMWFVLAAEDPRRIREVISDIEAQTRCTVHDMPKLEEFYVGLRLEA